MMTGQTVAEGGETFRDAFDGSLRRPTTPLKSAMFWNVRATPSCAISLGFEDPAHPANGFRTDRAPLAEVIDWRD